MIVFSFLCIFIPSISVSKTIYPELSFEQLMNSSVNCYEPTIAFYINPKSPHYKKLSLLIIQAENIFHGIKFARISSNSIKHFNQIQNLSPNIAVCFQDGKLIASYPIPVDSCVFFRMIDSTLNQILTLTSLSDLYSHLGSAQYALVARYNDIQAARNLINQSSQYIGFIDLLSVTNDVFKEAILNESAKFGFYRKEDGVIDPISNSTEEIFAATYPVFRILQRSDLKINEPLFIITSNKLNDEWKTILYEIGSKNKDIIVSWCPQELKYMLPFKRTTDALFIIPSEKIIFNISNFILENTTNWISYASDIFDSYRNGTLEANYKSEPEPDISNPQKVVGTTYEKFITCNKDAALVMYVNSDSDLNITINLLKNISSIFGNVSDLRIGYIDLRYNNCRIRFPEMIDAPHLRIFYKNKSIPIYSRRNANDIARAIKYFVNISHINKIVIPNPDYNISEHIISVIQKSYALKASARKELTSYLTFEAYLMNNDPSDSDSNKGSVTNDPYIEATNNEPNDDDFALEQDNLTDGHSSKESSHPAFREESKPKGNFNFEL